MDGHKVKIVETEITKPDSIKTIENEGMPILNTYPTQYGNLNVHFEIIFPNKLTSQQYKAIESLGLWSNNTKSKKKKKVKKKRKRQQSVRRKQSKEYIDNFGFPKQFLNVQPNLFIYKNQLLFVDFLMFVHVLI